MDLQFSTYCILHEVLLHLQLSKLTLFVVAIPCRGQQIILQFL